MWHVDVPFKEKLLRFVLARRDKECWMEGTARASQLPRQEEEEEEQENMVGWFGLFGPFSLPYTITIAEWNWKFMIMSASQISRQIISLSFWFVPQSQSVQQEQEMYTNTRGDPDFFSLEWEVKLITCHFSSSLQISFSTLYIYREKFCFNFVDIVNSLLPENLGSIQDSRSSSYGLQSVRMNWGWNGWNKNPSSSIPFIFPSWPRCNKLKVLDAFWTLKKRGLSSHLPLAW